MSDVGSRTLLSPGVSQFPVGWYFDEKLFELEKKLIFDAGPGYVGHELMVPEVHDYRSQEWNDHARLVTRQSDGFYEMSNVCRHRQAIMLQGAGNAKNVVCPIHRWTYDTGGELIGAPHFPANPCLNLAKQKLEKLAKQLKLPVWTPLDMRQQYYSNKGSIYGVVTDRLKNLGFKAPKQSTRYPNLFFVGGSVNPGGGMPMVVLCGQNVAKAVATWDRQ